MRSEVTLTKKAAEANISNAKKDRANVIAMTTHGSSDVSRWVCGSIAHKALWGATAPVLLARLKGATGRAKSG